ncbi:MAG: glycosyltransferase family 4 protein [bacterium]
MNFWIINHYAVPPEFYSGTRHFDLAKGLIETYNSKVLVFASNFSHFSFKYIVNIDKKLSFSYIKKTFDNVDFIFFNIPSYRGNGIFRLFNMLFFAINIYINSLKISKEEFVPDVIIGSSVHPFAALSAYLISKRLRKIYKKDIKFVFEERDLWPQYLYPILKSIKNPIKKFVFIIFFKILYFIQQFLYKNSDKLIFLQKKGLENAKKYLNKSIYLFQIYRKIDYNINSYTDQDFEEIRKKYRYLFCFAGGITITYAIKEIVLAFKYLDSNEFAFVIFGGGDYLNEILKTIRENNINNVFYLGFKRKELIRNYYLKKADFLVIPCSFDVKIDFSSNKLIDYLEQKKPIIIIGYNLLDIINEVGFVIEDRDPQIIANKIKEIVNLDTQVLENKINKGYEYLINELDYKVAAKKLYEFIKS